MNPILPTGKAKQGRGNRQHPSSKGAWHHPEPGRGGGEPFLEDLERETEGLQRGNVEDMERRVSSRFCLVNLTEPPRASHTGQVWGYSGSLRSRSADPGARGGRLGVFSRL